MADESFPSERETLEAAHELIYHDVSPEEQARVLFALPDPPEDAEDTLVVTSVRLPLGLHRRLKAYAEARNTTPSVLIRGWVETHLVSPDRVVSLDAVLRAIASVRPEQVA